MPPTTMLQLQQLQTMMMMTQQLNTMRWQLRRRQVMQRTLFREREINVVPCLMVIFAAASTVVEPRTRPLRRAWWKLSVNSMSRKRQHYNRVVAKAVVSALRDLGDMYMNLEQNRHDMEADRNAREDALWQQEVATWQFQTNMQVQLGQLLSQVQHRTIHVPGVHSIAVDANGNNNTLGQGENNNLAGPGGNSNGVLGLGESDGPNMQ